MTISAYAPIFAQDIINIQTTANNALSSALTAQTLANTAIINAASALSAANGAATLASGAVPLNEINKPNGVAGLDSYGNASSLTVIPTGGSSTLTLAQVAYDALNAASSLANLNTTTSITLAEYIGITDGTNSYKIASSNFISSLGTPVPNLSAAGSASGTDTVITNQNGTVGLQTVNNISNFVLNRFTTFVYPIVELTTNTTLNSPAHNNRILICSQPITISIPSSFIGSGFTTTIINLSSGNVTLGSGFISSSGSTVISTNGYVEILAYTYSGATGGAYYANFGGTGIPPVGLTITVSNPNVSAGQSVNVTGTVNPSGTSVQIGYSTSTSTQPTTWSSATVSNYSFSGTLTGFSGGTYYAWCRETGNTSITAFSSTPITVSGGTGLTYSLISGSGNGTFSTGSMAGLALTTNVNASDWSSTITHGSTDISPAVNLSLGQGIINSCKFWFDSSATNLIPGTYGNQAGFPGGSFVAFYINSVQSTPIGAPAAPSTTGTYYGKYAFYDSSNNLLGVFVTSAISII